MNRAWIAIGAWWLAVGPAYAADPWTGVYIGGAMGAGQIDSTYRDYLFTKGFATHRWEQTLDNGDHLDVIRTDFHDESSFGFGAEDGDYGRLMSPFIGASLRFGPVVLGGEFSFDLTKFDNWTEVVAYVDDGHVIELSQSVNGGPFVTNTTDYSEKYSHSYVNTIDLEWKANVIGRLGYLVSDDLLVYGLVGWTRGHFEVTILNYELDGWTTGGGAEYALGHGLSFRAEYRHTVFEDRVLGRGALTTSGSDHHLTGLQRYVDTTETHDVRLGIAYQLWQP